MILVAGEALVDLVPDDEGRLVPHPGGGPFNAARTMARLGAPAALLTRLSTDAFGATLRAALDADGVLPDALVATDDPTTLALVEGADGQAAYRFYSAQTAAAGLTADVALAAVPSGTGALHVGTLGLVFEPLATAVEAVVAGFEGPGIVFCDPNCRPAAIRDEDAYRARLARVLGHCHVVKASDDDLAWLSPGADPVDAARVLLERGPTVVLVTRGAAGATIVTAAGSEDVAAPQVDVVDAIGAGDAFGGGFLAWLHRDGHGREALADPALVRAATDYGVRVAARTCERAGATPPTRAELPA